MRQGIDQDQAELHSITAGELMRQLEESIQTQTQSKARLVLGCLRHVQHLLCCLDPAFHKYLRAVMFTTMRYAC